MAKKSVSKKRVAKKRVAKKPVARKSAKKKKRTTSTKTASRPKPKAAVKRKPARSTRTRSSSSGSDLQKLDREIVDLLNRRAAATIKLLEADAKSAYGSLDAVVNTELTATLESANSGPLPLPAIRNVFRELISGARCKLRTHRVAYLGPPYSFTHLAAIERFGKSAHICPVRTIAAVFEEVNRGHADFGIVPIENSTDGRVVDTLDMFTRLPLRICGEVQIGVHHHLLARCPRSEIVEIYSKPQALSQCRDWLARNMPQARLIEVTSTSTAAQLARDKPGAAAVASQQAAAEYHLDIIASSIEDNANNVTRFDVIGDETCEPTGHDRTAVLLQIPHNPGSLADALDAFKRNKINLTWIESFPLRGDEVGYLFFMDFEGHEQDPKIKRALGELEKKAVRM